MDSRDHGAAEHENIMHDEVMYHRLREEDTGCCTNESERSFT
jgi:hypothetical protein